MRRILSVAAIAITAACSDEGTGPSPGEPQVASLRIEGPETISASESVRLTVSLLDALGRPVSNRPIAFASSDPGIAAVDGFGVVRALAEGIVTITASSGSVRGTKILRVVSSATGPATTFLWVMVVEDSGVCIPGATIRVLQGQRAGESFTQKTPCDAWAYDGGVLFENLRIGEEMTLQATAPGYLAQEKRVVPTSGAQTAFLFTPPRDR